MSDPSVATVDAHGLATTTTLGTTSVTATSEEGITSNSATLNVVAQETYHIQVRPDFATMPTSSERYFRAYQNFNDGTSVEITDSCTWTSEDTQLFSAYSGGRIKSYTNLGVGVLRAYYKGKHSSTVYITVVEAP